MKILYISSVSYGWHKQRPQFICDSLSKNHKVYYTSFTPLGKKKFSSLNHTENLNVKDLYVLPFAFESSVVRAVNKLIVNMVLKMNRFDCIIVTHPIFMHYLPENVRVIYECMDNMSAFYCSKRKELLKNWERKLCQRCESIITSSKKIKENLICDYNVESEKITIINNAVDKAWVKQQKSAVELKKPNMVYVGTIDSWFDFDVIEAFCKAYPENYVYIVGKVNCDTKSFPQNMIFTGKVEHEKVFSYIKSADIVILPFKVNELIECVDPVKMYEYLALNKTVISSYWQELEKFENVHFYRTKEEFLKLAETVKPNETKISQQFIDRNCWEERIKDYEKILIHNK